MRQCGFAVEEQILSRLVQYQKSFEDEDMELT